MGDSKILKRREDTQKRDSTLTNTTQKVKSFTPPPTGIDPIPVQNKANSIQLMQKLPIEDKPDYFKPNLIQQLQVLPEEQRPERFQPNLIQKIQRGKVNENGKVIQKKDESDKKETADIEEASDAQIDTTTETKSEIISSNETIDENGEVTINISARVTIKTTETHTPEHLLTPPTPTNNINEVKEKVKLEGKTTTASDGFKSYGVSVSGNLSNGTIDEGTTDTSNKWKGGSSLSMENIRPEFNQISNSSTNPNIKAGNFYEIVKDKNPVKAEENVSTLNFDIDKAVKYLNDHVEATPNGKCATFVRRALEAGGLDSTGRPRYAKNYGPFLLNKGFVGVKKDNYIPQKGDIIVLQDYPGGHPAGHIAIYNGTQWVSEFKQRDMWAGPGYRKHKPNYQIFRAP